MEGTVTPRLQPAHLLLSFHFQQQAVQKGEGSKLAETKRNGLANGHMEQSHQLPHSLARKQGCMKDRVSVFPWEVQSPVWVYFELSVDGPAEHATFEPPHGTLL